MQQLLLVVAMLATSLLLSSPADAQTGAECAEGVLQGTQCVIEGAPPTNGPATCPVSATVQQDGNECYTLINPAPQCPAGSIEDANGDCRKPVADQPGSLTCESDFGLVDGDCVRFEAPIPNCVNGTLIGSNCVIPGNPPTNGPSTCPISATVLQDGNECYTLIAPPVVPGTCSSPYIAFGGICKTNNTGTTQAEVAAFTCPAGPAGVFVLENMHTVGGVAKIESCEYTPAATTGPCPAGTTQDPNGVDCRRPVALRPGALMCETGFGFINGSCVRYEAPDDLTCVTGTLVGLQCVITGNAPVQGPSTCPAGSLGQPGGCYILVSKGPTTCPAGTTPDPNGIDCRVPVALVPGGLVCETGFGLVDGSCVRFEAAIYRCVGQIVTINMVAGDSGQGTSGNDVILGTSGADTINSLGGDDLICALGGDDIINGGSGNDTIYGNGGADTIFGISGDDVIIGGADNDTIRGGAGNDDLLGSDGDDDVRGGADDDLVRGGSGNDLLAGNIGDDDLRGNAGNDTLYGGADADVLRGGLGDDLLLGQGGDDDLRGNGDQDVCNGGPDTDIARASCEVTSNIA